MDAWNSLSAEVVAANTVKEFKHAWDRHKAILHIWPLSHLRCPDPSCTPFAGSARRIRNNASDLKAFEDGSVFSMLSALLWQPGRY